MSVSNLLAPNDYILYTNDFYANNFDSVDFGSTVAFGAAKATGVTLGNASGETDIIGNPVIINGQPYPPFGPGATGNNCFYGPGTGTTGCTGIGNAGFGLYCLHNITGGDYNVAVGDDALLSLTTGNNNIGIGTDALLNLQSANENIAIGANSMVQGETGAANVALGYGTLYYAEGSSNIAIGTNAGAGYTGFESNNICIGNLGTATDQSVIRIGTSQSNAFCAGIYGITGVVNNHKGVLVSSTGHLVTEAPNVFIGEGAGNGATGVTGNVGIGIGALASITTDNGSIAIGPGALTLQKGLSSLATSCIAIGPQALANNINGFLNIGIGYKALNGLTGNANNIAIGPNALLHTDGLDNVAIGLNSGAAANRTNGTYNTMVGVNSMSAGGTGDFNTAIGGRALQSVNSNSNIALGYAAGSSQTGATGNNIYIGNVGSAGDANAIFIGTQGSHSSAFCAGIHGVTTGTTGIAVLVDFNGQLGTVSSSRSLKENIQPMWDVKDVIAGLEPVSFNFKVGGGKTVGLIADDAKKYVPELIVPLGRKDDEGNELETVQYHLLPIYLLKELKRQQQVIDCLGVQLDSLLEHKKESV